MSILDLDEEINLINNNNYYSDKIFMNEENSQVPNSSREIYQSTNNGKKIKKYKFITLLMYSCFIFLGFINHIGYYFIHLIL